MTIGQRIRNRRIELGLSVEELAERLGKNRATVYRYESNAIKDLPVSVLESVAIALHTTPADLMGTNQEEEQPYYYDPETSEIAEAVFRDPDLRMLFDAARDTNPDNIRLAAEMLRRFKNTNPDG